MLSGGCQTTFRLVVDTSSSSVRSSSSPDTTVGAAGANGFSVPATSVTLIVTVCMQVVQGESAGRVSPSSTVTVTS